MIVVDTSVLSGVFRRRPNGHPRDQATEQFIALTTADAPIAIPGIVVQELLSGVRTSEAFHQLDAALSGFRLLLASRATHRLGATIRNQCRRAGIAAATTDCLIAAHAVEHDAALFTVDQDFQRMAKHCELRLLEHPKQT
jgi:predicted nucleic acid-binding protein